MASPVEPVPDDLKEEIDRLIESGKSAYDLDIKCYEDIIMDNRLDLLVQLFSSWGKDDKKDMFEILYEHRGTHEHTRMQTLLYWAVHYKRSNIIRYLVQEGMDIDRNSYDSGYTALHHAAELGDESFADVLLELGASVYRLTFHGRYGFKHLLPFQLAVDKGHMDLGVTMLLPANINDPDRKGDRKDRSHNTPHREQLTILMYACYAEDETSAKMLVENGADPNLAVNGVLPFQLAILNRRQKIIDYLYPLTDLSLIKWSKVMLDEAIANCLDGSTDEECHTTVAEEPLLVYLLKQGAGVNQTDNKKLDNEAPLITACQASDIKHLRILLEYGASPNIQCNTIHTNGLCTSLYIAVFMALTSGQDDGFDGVEILKILLKANPDTQRLSQIGVELKAEERNAYLHGFPHDFNIKTTPLQEALLGRDGEVITLCVEAGFCLYDTKLILGAVKDHINPPLDDDIIELIEKYDNTPRSLEHLAKFAVRRCLGHKDVEAKIDKLEVPKGVNEYLKDIGICMDGDDDQNDDESCDESI